MTQYLKQLDAASAMKALFTLAFRKHPSREFGTSDSSEGAQSNQQKEMHIKLMSEDFMFASGNGGGVVIKYQSGDSEDSPGCGDEDILAHLTGVGVSPQETRALCIVELLMPLKTQQLAGDFFLYLMEKLTNFISGNEETYQKKGSFRIKQFPYTYKVNCFKLLPVCHCILSPHDIIIPLFILD